jgi:hypothetical protein
MAALSDLPETYENELPPETSVEGVFDPTTYDPTAYIKSVINVELFSDEFYPYMHQLDISITRDRFYQGTCTFHEPEIPPPIKEGINEMVQRIITDFNTKLREEESEASESDNPLSKTYDIVILVQTHGCYNNPERCVPEELPETPYEKYVSFLEAVPCGVSNITYRNWHEKTRDTYERLKKTLGPTKTLAKVLQYSLRYDKELQLKDLTSGYNQFLIPRLKGRDEEKKEMARAFIREPGWKLFTSSSSYANRHYGRDKDWPLSIVVIDCVRKELIGRQLHRDIPEGQFNRRGLLQFLFANGFKHPLIIDNSCGSIHGTKSANRYASLSLKRAGLTGGTRKRKRKSLKRPKVKKFIYFT